MPVKLRPYQTQAVEQVRAQLQRGRTRIIVCAPTGSGKTVLATHMIERSVSLGNSILFLAHRRELIVQAWKKIVGCTCPVGFDHVNKKHSQCEPSGLPISSVGIMMGNDPRRNPRAVVQVASIDTLRNRAKPPADVIIIDETHRALAKTYRQILDHYKDATVFGLTATPYRADGRGLGELYEHIVVVASPRMLVDDGFLVDPRVFTVPAKDLPNLSKVRIKGGDYDTEALSAAVDQTGLVGNVVDHWVRLADGRRTVVFAVDVSHSKNICARFVEVGVRAEHLDGATPTAERDAILSRLDSGETQVVCSVGTLTEGWDQPSVKCVILARPTKSLGLYLQMAGRILRPWGNTTAIILDHSGNVLEHGLPTDEREFSLEPPPKRTSKRESAPACKTCEKCFAIVASAVRECPACGWVFPIAEEDKTEEKEGELVEVRAASMEERRAEYDRLAAVAQDRGYKSGWIYHRFREKFGVPPPREWQPKKEAHEYTEEEKRAYLENLKSVRQERGYAIEWVYKRFHGKFGVGVPSAWMLPSLRLVKSEPAPSKVEWAV